MGIEPRLVEERAWERRREFLLMAAEERDPGPRRGSSARRAGPRRDRRISRRDPRAGARRPAAPARGPRGRAEARRLAAWFNVKFFNETSGNGSCARRSSSASCAPGEGRRRTRHGDGARGALQRPLSSALHRPSDPQPQLARRRPPDRRRPRSGGASLLPRLSRRRAVGGERDRGASGTRGSSRGRRFACFSPTACPASRRARPTRKLWIFETRAARGGQPSPRCASDAMFDEGEAAPIARWRARPSVLSRRRRRPRPRAYNKHRPAPRRP